MHPERLTVLDRLHCHVLTRIDLVVRSLDTPLARQHEPLSEWVDDHAVTLFGKLVCKLHA